MAINEQIRILDDKIKQNQGDYDLYRQNAKISALSSDKLDKYEYLTGEDLGYRRNPVQKAKFEYSPLGQVFNKGLDSSEKQEGLLKRLKNTEGRNEQQLDLIRDQEDRQLDAIGRINTSKIKSIGFYDKKSEEAQALVNKINKVIEKFKGKNFVYVRSDSKIDNFTDYKDLNELGKEIHFGNISVNEVKKQQKRLLEKMHSLKKQNKKQKNKKQT